MVIYEKSKTAPRTGPGPAVPPPHRLRDPDRVRSSANTRARRNRDCIRDCRNAARAGAGWMEVRSLPRGDARWLGNRLRREDLAGQRLGQLRAAVLVGQLRRVRHGSEGRNGGKNWTFLSFQGKNSGIVAWADPGAGWFADKGDQLLAVLDTVEWEPAA